MMKTICAVFMLVICLGAQAAERVTSIVVTSDETSSPVSVQLFETVLEGGGRYGVNLDWSATTSGGKASLQLLLTPSAVHGAHIERRYQLDLSKEPRRVDTTFLLPEGEAYSARLVAVGALRANISLAELRRLPRLTEAQLRASEGLVMIKDSEFEPFGICQHMDRSSAPHNRPKGWGSYTDEEVEETLDVMADGPTQWVRVSASWGRLEPQKGQYNQAYIARLDRIMDRLDAAGIKYYIQIGGTANWASSAKVPPYWNYPPKEWSDWENAVRFLGERYHKRSVYWEILNEPDWHFWKGSVEEYVEALKRASKTLKSVNSKILVLNGGLSSDGVLSWPDVEQQWLQKAFDLGAGEAIDIFSQHMYTGTMEEAVYRVNRFYRVMERNGQGDKPIWITEIGMSTFTKDGGFNYTEKDQQKYLIDLYTILTRHPKVDKVFWYNFRCKGMAVNDKESNFGIYNTDLSPRLSGRAYADLNPPPTRRINLDFLKIDALDK